MLFHASNYTLINFIIFVIIMGFITLSLFFTSLRLFAIACVWSMNSEWLLQFFLYCNLEIASEFLLNAQTPWRRVIKKKKKLRELVSSSISFNYNWNSYLHREFFRLYFYFLYIAPAVYKNTHIYCKVTRLIYMWILRLALTRYLYATTTIYMCGTQALRYFRFDDYYRKCCKSSFTFD